MKTTKIDDLRARLADAEKALAEYRKGPGPAAVLRALKAEEEAEAAAQAAERHLESIEKIASVRRGIRVRTADSGGEPAWTPAFVAAVETHVGIDRSEAERLTATDRYGTRRSGSFLFDEALRCAEEAIIAEDPEVQKARGAAAVTSRALTMASVRRRDAAHHGERLEWTARRLARELADVEERKEQRAAARAQRPSTGADGARLRAAKAKLVEIAQGKKQSIVWPPKGGTP